MTKRTGKCMCGMAGIILSQGKNYPDYDGCIRCWRNVPLTQYTCNEWQMIKEREKNRIEMKRCRWKTIMRIPMEWRRTYKISIAWEFVHSTYGFVWVVQCVYDCGGYAMCSLCGRKCRRCNRDLPKQHLISMQNVGNVWARQCRLTFARRRRCFQYDCV